MQPRSSSIGDDDPIVLTQGGVEPASPVIKCRLDGRADTALVHRKSSRHLDNQIDLPQLLGSSTSSTTGTASGPHQPGASVSSAS